MKILITLEGESYSYSPVMVGKIIARATGGSIDVLVLLPKDGHLEDAQAVVDQVKQDLEHLVASIHIEQGDPGDLVKQELEDEDYNLVIASADKIHRVRKSVEIDPIFIKSATVSLLLTQNTKPRLERLLVCTACQENDYSLVSQAAKLAKDLGGSATLMTVFPGSVPSMYTGLEKIEETVEEFLQTDTPYARYLRRGIEIFRDAKVPAEVKIRWGIPIEEIVRETQIINYDLVVIGSSRVNQGLKEMLMGNMTSKIIDRVELPVLIIGTRELA